MEHTNKIIIEVLKETHSDYTENQWHYDSDYKMIEKAISKAVDEQIQEKYILNTPTLKEINTLYFRRLTKKERGYMFEAACNLPDKEKRLTKLQFKALRGIWGIPKGYTEKDFKQSPTVLSTATNNADSA